MSKTTTTTITVTVTADALMSIFSGKYKGVTMAGVTTPATPAIAPKAPTVYDATTCDAIPGADKLTAFFNPLRGTGMLARVCETLKVDYSMANTLVSAEAAARKAERTTLFIVPSKASAVRAIIDTL